MIGAAVVFMVIAPAALAKVSSPEAKGVRPKPSCSISGSRKGSAPMPMRKSDAADHRRTRRSGCAAAPRSMIG